MKPFNNVTEKIVPADICVGCGMCEAVCPHTTLDMRVSQLGEYQPVVIDKCFDLCTLCMDVCPFDTQDQDEDTLGLSRYGQHDGAQHDTSLGYFLTTYVGHVADGADREVSASGGLASLFLKELLNRGEVDAVIVPQPTNNGSPWFEMAIVDDVEAIDRSRGSVYSPVHMGDVLRTVAWGPDRTYAIVTLPCFAKAIRLAQEKFPKLQRRIKCVLGLVCGGAKSLQFPELLSALSGGSDTQIEFRSKHHAQTAPDFRFTTKKDDEITGMVRFQGLFGFLWMNNFSSLRSCLFCDDVFAELADIVFMDAWLPEYKPDRQGTSLMICRNQQVDSLLQRMKRDNLWSGDPIDPAKVEASQAGVVAKKCAQLLPRIEVAREKAFVPAKRCEQAAVDVAVSPAEKDRARRELAALDQGKQAFQVASARWQGKSSLARRAAAWRSCLQFYYILRAARIRVVRAKTLLFLSWIPHPKVVLRRLKRLVKR